MSDVRDPERDQPLPRPGGLPVQAILIRAIQERMQFGIRKYGRPLETNNGRDPLRDMWEEMLDMVSYFTQYVLEQGVVLPGMEKAASQTQVTGGATGTPPLFLIPEACPICTHEPHIPGGCRSGAPGGPANCPCGVGVAAMATG